MKSKLKILSSYMKLLVPFFLFGLLFDFNIYKRPSFANSDLKPAKTEDIILYEGMGVSYVCLSSRKEINLDFQKSLSVAASTFVSVIQSKHGNKVIDQNKEISIENKILYENALFRILGRAIQTCPDNVPKKSKEEFNKLIKQLQNSKKK